MFGPLTRFTGFAGLTERPRRKPESSRRLLPAPAALLLIAAALLPGCGALGAEGGPRGETLTVFAASSLTDAFEETAEEFERENPGVRVRLNFAASSTLAAQISQGAPAGVFAAADRDQMQNVRGEGLISAGPQTFATNREVVLVPDENPAGIEEFRDLSETGTRLVIAQEGVPAAEYAEEVLAKAAGDPEYGEDFEREVLGNVVSREADARAAVNRVVTGDADAAFGYASDVTPDVREEVRVVEIPPRLNVAAEYRVSTLESARSPGLAREWVEFVLSEEGQRTLGEWGFGPAAG